MTIETTANRISYTGSGTTGPFSFPYYFLADGDLTVIKTTIADGTEETLTLTTDYTVSGAGEAAGGSVTLVATLSSAYKLTIIRDPDILQPADYPANDRFPAATHEEALDRATMILQRLKDLIDRSFHLSDGDVSGISLTLSNLGAGRLIAVNSAGTGIESIAAADVDLATVTPFIQTLLDDATAATARTTLGAASLGANTFTGLQTFAAGADIASATTVDLTAATGNLVRITGTTTTTGVTINNGQVVLCYPTGAWPLTYHATNMPIKGGASYTCAAGDTVIFSKDGNGTLHVDIFKADGTALVVNDTITIGSNTNLTGTNIDITGIAAGVNGIDIHIASLSTNGTSLPLLILGDSGGFETSGYIGANSLSYPGPNWLGNTFSAAFELTPSIAAATVFSGLIQLRKLGGNFWTASWILCTSNSAAGAMGSGYKQLSGELTQLRLIMANATDTFDGGSVTVNFIT